MIVRRDGLDINLVDENEIKIWNENKLMSGRFGFCKTELGIGGNEVIVLR
ncbi:hypothetical protein ATG70_3312 [Bacillus sp. es.036]|nr:hypothetical protein ATG70_3312 [Bacillus sp. es.036]